ncbi:MAG: hypothetical protein QY314_02865 [Candidatus Dojkabacteria bacterium]|nr:MAG: hypothetical protein QY314_02865 [Candidatus Dojkabacteria bacterium]
MKTSVAILQYIKERKEASAKEITDFLDISSRAVFKQLAKLTQERVLTKIGKPPKVFYKLIEETPEIRESTDNAAVYFTDEQERIIAENFLYITPLGEYFEGINAFIKWCHDRSLNPLQQADQYKKIVEGINKSRKNGLISAKSKIKSEFGKSYLKEVYYLDFYAIPQFGKTKLGQLLLYAKQSQDKARIRMISEIAKPRIQSILQAHRVNAVAFIPPTVKREIQFIKELERNLNISLPMIKVSKVKTPIIVPQKTLNKLEDRVLNARNTLVVDDQRVFKRVLLIDDAVGSGATLNETAKKLIESKQAKEVYGLAITGSYKGFDVISEV